jgi:hypothetical protein
MTCCHYTPVQQRRRQSNFVPGNNVRDTQCNRSVDVIAELDILGSDTREQRIFDFQPVMPVEQSVTPGTGALGAPLPCPARAGLPLARGRRPTSGTAATRHQNTTAFILTSTTIFVFSP